MQPYFRLSKAETVRSFSDACGYGEPKCFQHRSERSLIHSPAAETVCFKIKLHLRSTCAREHKVTPGASLRVTITEPSVGMAAGKVDEMFAEPE
jgi:hypothetical protein